MRDGLRSVPYAYSSKGRQSALRRGALTPSTARHCRSDHRAVRSSRRPGTNRAAPAVPQRRTLLRSLQPDGDAVLSVRRSAMTTIRPELALAAAMLALAACGQTPGDRGLSGAGIGGAAGAVG